MKKIEKRYLVIKISDIEQATQEGFLEHGALGYVQQIVKEIEYFRKECGKDPLRALVVEKDWPEYPAVYAALEARINNAPSTMLFSQSAGKYHIAKMVGYTSHLTKTITGDPGKLHVDEFGYTYDIPKFYTGGTVKKDDALLNFAGVVTLGQAYNMSTEMEKWFEHTHCINWLSACPRCKTTAARVKTTSPDSNHLLDNDAVECVHCGNTGHIEIFNSDADVAWDVADGE